jgi:hypothetical protein
MNRARSRRLGCGGALLCLAGLVLLVFAVAVAVNPWSVHIGDGFTPTMRWEGYGFATAPSGATYGVYLHMQPTRRPQRTIHGGSSLTGNGAVCTSHATFSYGSASGVLHAWWSTDGATMNLTLIHGSGVAKSFSLEFQGVWQGSTFQASDGGRIAQHTTPDGQYQSGPLPPPNPAAATTFLLRSGSASAFRAACQRMAGG